GRQDHRAARPPWRAQRSVPLAATRARISGSAGVLSVDLRLACWRRGNSDRFVTGRAAGKESSVGILNEDMKRVVREQRLAFVATVCEDNTPNLSPKGTIAVWDDDHLVFANIRSPQTIANLRRNAAVEVNVVDPFARKGFRFKGTATVLESGARYDEVAALFDEVTAFFAARGFANP